jgi:hypothetical protein
MYNATLSDSYQPPCSNGVGFLGRYGILYERTGDIHASESFVFVCRYVVVLNDRQTIYDALVRQSLELADRPHFYFQTLWNPQRKGDELTIDYEIGMALKGWKLLILFDLKYEVFMLAVFKALRANAQSGGNDFFFACLCLQTSDSGQGIPLEPLWHELCFIVLTNYCIILHWLKPQLNSTQHDLLVYNSQKAGFKNT